MYNKISFMGVLNERTGYGVHASRFVEQLSKLCEVHVNKGAIEGAVHISLIDSVSIQNVNERLPYPSLLYNIWESTSQPDWFMERLKFFDGLLVGSEWQRAASIAQGIPEEFVKVVPEGVDPDVYKPREELVEYLAHLQTFNFVHVGQWQPRKSTIEICQAFLKAFPRKDNVLESKIRLYLSVDTLFPSDNFKSTEERLAHYGLTDPRIIVVHHEERDLYIRRLQSAHCFVSCSRSEGWGLPIIEAMACGIPTIVADWSGSTEYAGGAIRVPIRKLIEPYGIYGNWKVPGQWCEPDWERLDYSMKMVYNNYAHQKEIALKESEKIRTKFSWAAAAKKAYDIINEMEEQPVDNPVDNPVHNPVDNLLSALDPETKIRAFARQHGYEINSLHKQKIIFTMDTHPDSPEKIACLKESIKQVKDLGYPLLLTAHFPLPAGVIKMVDFYIYDKRDIMSGEDRPVYSRVGASGQMEYVKSSKPCHALASTMNCRNGIDFCIQKGYDWIYHMSYDAEVDLAVLLAKVKESKKDLIGTRWDHQQDTFGGQFIAGKTEVMDKLLPRMETWEEFVKEYGDQRFNSEQGMLRRAIAAVGPDGFDIIDIEIGNRFDQVDREAWKDDIFQCHFVEGPYLNIQGISTREYEVTWSNPIEGKAVYVVRQKPGMWSRPAMKFYREWTVTARLDGQIKFQHTLNLEGRNVIVSLGSKALGDTIAWIPYVEEFRKKYHCNVYLSSWWNQIFDYPEIRFIQPGSVVENVYASYEIGCFDNQPDKNPKDWRTVNLQQVASDQLGIDYTPIRAKLKYTPTKKGGNGSQPKPYICFSEFSTMQCKLWNNKGAWQKVIDELISLGYDCHCISAEQSQLSGIINHCGQPIEKTLTDLSGAEFYIGLNAGPTWLAVAIGIPVFMITGVSEPWNDFPDIHRISIDVCRPGCFNDPTLPIERGWDWCPRNKDYACTREITPEMVMAEIKVWKEKSDASQIREIKQDGKRERKRDGSRRLSSKTGSGRSTQQCRPIEERA